MTGDTMPHLDYVHVDVFANRPFGGNSLPVFFDAPDLTPQAMLAITQELRHFEAIFLQPTDSLGVVRARVFDLFEELPFAGHPIIGAAVVLQHRAAPRQSGDWAFDLSGRQVTVSVTYARERYFGLLDQGHPGFHGIVDSRAEIAKAFGLDADDLDNRFPIEVVSTGLRYMVVPLSPGCIGRARIGVDITSLMESHDAQFAVLLDADASEVRHWNNDGIIEDVATGSAAGVIGAYCHKHRLLGLGAALLLSQGRFAGRPSQLQVEVEESDGEIVCVKVGGGVAFVGEGRIAVVPGDLT